MVALAMLLGMGFAMAEVRDLDGDGIPNVVDPDVDNDGIPNALDQNIDGGIALSGPFKDQYIGDHEEDNDPSELDMDDDGLNDDSLGETDIDGDGFADVEALCRDLIHYITAFPCIYNA